MLRDFYYLNQSSIDDYLSQLQGYVEEEIEVTDDHKNLVKGGIKLGAEMGGEANHSYGTKKIAKISYTDKFNKLHDLLEKHLQKDLSNAQKGSLYEFEGMIKIPEIVRQLITIAGLLPNASSLMSEEIRLASAQQPEYLNSILSSFTDKMFNLQSFPVLITTAPKTDLQPFSKLEKMWIRRDVSEWHERELTFLGKAVRLQPKGHTKRVGIISDIEEISNLDRVQKAKLDKKASIEVKGPSLEIRIIAVWE